MKTYKFGLLAILVIAVSALPLRAAVIYSGGGPQSFNFDGMPTSGATPPTTLTSPFSATTGVQAGVTGSGGWEATRLSGTGTTPMPFIADEGSSNSGAIHSYGAAAAADRALGTLASGSNVPGFGIEFVNNTTNPIFEVRINFTQENWRSSTTNVNTIQASYSTSDAGAASANYLTTGTFTDVDSLDLVGAAAVATNGALNGNLLVNQLPRAAVITGLDIDPGQSFFLRFQDTNETGNDAGLGIDDFTIALIPEPASIALMFGCIGALALRRK